MNLGSEIGHVYMDMPPESSSLVEAQVEVNSDIVRNVVKTAASLNCPVLVHQKIMNHVLAELKLQKRKSRWFKCLVRKSFSKI